jgi:rare lipoprotein A (peptidoglycan hydrolase)
VVLGSSSPGDLASVQIYAARAIGLSGASVDRVKALRAEAAAATVELDRVRADLAGTTDELEKLAAQALQQLSAAQDSARQAGIRVRDLVRRQRALARARAAADAAVSRLVDAERGLDQSALLALLGPTGGRDFAGRPTATGAIYDPRLFTAANKELPLDTFLRIHFGGRCAVVLVNDRGPYAPGRVFDLSEAAAQYLGVGLNDVVADVLVPI